MKTYVATTIAGIKSPASVEDFEHHLLIASDLLVRNFSAHVKSAFSDIDFSKESLDQSDLDSVQSALLETLSRDLSLREESAVLSALSVTGDAKLKPVFEHHLEKHLRLLLRHSGALYSALLGLDRLGVPVFASGGRSCISISENISSAQQHLSRIGIVVSWGG
jgi:hypothetical protein